MKKIITILLAATLFLATVTSTAVADNALIENENIAISNFNNAAKEKFDDYLNASAKSLNVPTSYWNISSLGQYNARLEQVCTSWLYTNYYFKANSSRRLHFCGRVYSNTGRPTVMIIGLYNMSKGKIVATREVTSSLAGQYFEDYFYDLSSTSNYAIAFHTVFDGSTHDSVHGNAQIYH